MDPIRKIPKKFTKKAGNKVNNKQYFRRKTGLKAIVLFLLLFPAKKKKSILVHILFDFRPKLSPLNVLLVLSYLPLTRENETKLQFLNYDQNKNDQPSKAQVWYILKVLTRRKGHQSQFVV